MSNGGIIKNNNFYIDIYFKMWYNKNILKNGV